MNEKLEVLQSVEEYIEKLYNAVNNVVDDFKQDNVQEGYTILAQIIDGLQWCIEAIYLTRDCQDEPIDLDKVTPLLVELLEGLENNDIVLIRDILEYEIIDILEEWHEKLAKIIEA